MTRLKFIVLFFFLIPLLLSVRVALADTGPKPTMEFTFNQEAGAQPLTITSGILYECQQADCRDAAPLQEAGPQRFTCEPDSCRALAYGFAPYHKLRIQFSDGKARESNIFANAALDARYTVIIRTDDLVVEAQRSVFPRLTTMLLLCLCLTVIGVLLIGSIVFFLRRCPKS
jgi:hypothetical protein